MRTEVLKLPAKCVVDDRWTIKSDRGAGKLSAVSVEATRALLPGLQSYKGWFERKMNAWMQRSHSVHADDAGLQKKSAGPTTLGVPAALRMHRKSF